jgi:selT/selW/selH-like putative selenoprotein
LPKAASLADYIEKQGFIHPELVKSSGGAFEVKIGEHLLFSKLNTGRFPEHIEILDLIKNKI